MKILKYTVAAGLTLLLLALAVEAQITVDRWARVQRDAVTGPDTLYTATDTLDQTKVIRIYTKDMPFNKWAIAVKLDTFVGKDPADSLYFRWWYLVNPGEGWTAKTRFDSAAASEGLYNNTWQYHALTLPVVKPCSVKVDLYAKDAGACSTKVKGIRFIAQ